MAKSSKTKSAKKRVKVKDLPASKRKATELTKPQMRGVTGGWAETEGWDEVPMRIMPTTKTIKPRQ